MFEDHGRYSGSRGDANPAEPQKTSEGEARPRPTDERSEEVAVATEGRLTDLGLLEGVDTSEDPS
jgi:hypothetical protein